MKPTHSVRRPSARQALGEVGPVVLLETDPEFLANTASGKRVGIIADDESSTPSVHRERVAMQAYNRASAFRGKSLEVFDELSSQF